MRVNTHKYIAETSIGLIEEITGMTFNHKLLRMGACAPDIALNRRVKIHNVNLAAAEYEKMLDKFQNGNRSIAFLSYILGVFSHYVADSFCFAHNYYVIDLKKHVQYEVLFQDMKDFIALPLDLKDTFNKKYEDLEQTSVLNYLQTENAKYRNLVESKTDWAEIAGIDLSLAIIHCTTVMLQFVYEVEVQRELAMAM